MRPKTREARRRYSAYLSRSATNDRCDDENEIIFLILLGRVHCRSTYCICIFSDWQWVRTTMTPQARGRAARSGFSSRIPVWRWWFSCSFSCPFWYWIRISLSRFGWVMRVLYCMRVTMSLHWLTFPLADPAVVLWNVHIIYLYKKYNSTQNSPVKKLSPPSNTWIQPSSKLTPGWKY